MIPSAARRSVAVLALLVTACATGSTAGAAGGAIAPRTVLKNVDFATGIAFLPDGEMVVNERPGRVLLVDQGVRRVVANVDTTVLGETGLLGVAVPPGPRPDSVYVFATQSDVAINRVLRIPLGKGDPEVVVDDLPASYYHNGGGLAFARDGNLLVTNGEQHNMERSQQPDVLGGKVYRFTPDGRIPADNPFGSSPALAIGLRNPFGIAIDPISDAAFVTENGPTEEDEVNRIVAGGNYGWPKIEGQASPSEVRQLTGQYVNPLLDYPHIIVPTGIAFADPATAKAQYRGDLFFGTYGQESIHRVVLDESRRRAVSDSVFLKSSEPVIALAWGPRGLYFSTPNEIDVLPLARGETVTRSNVPAFGRPQSGKEGGPPGWTLPAVVIAAIAGLALLVVIARRT
jgi:glucose/arabinose dehydrogenase